MTNHPEDRHVLAAAVAAGRPTTSPARSTEKGSPSAGL